MSQTRVQEKINFDYYFMISSFSFAPSMFRCFLLFPLKFMAFFFYHPCYIYANEHKYNLLSPFNFVCMYTLSKLTTWYYLTKLGGRYPEKGKFSLSEVIHYLEFMMKSVVRKGLTSCKARLQSMIWLHECSTFSNKSSKVIL